LLAFIEAFEHYFSTILTLKEHELESWKSDIRQDLALSLPLLVSLIPNLELLLGKQKDIKSGGAEESKNRLVFAFQSLIKFIATDKTPLIIFIDDAQWIDSASLLLLERLAGDDLCRYTQILVAYRKNEVIQGNRLFDYIIEIESNIGDSIIIDLLDLKPSVLTSLIDEGFQQRVKAPEVLAEYINSKTSGNPFFSLQLLSRLIEDGYIYLSESHYSV
jgi:predicted ATPase